VQIALFVRKVGSIPTAPSISINLFREVVEMITMADSALVDIKEMFYHKEKPPFKRVAILMMEYHI